ncbi:type VI secretion system protein ImpA [Paracoccus isoporae]|uniref:Type VI secretion system protein ImpA n=1 Tax=Paracoccus isoporae TaxID=591205 RepID=A0A1G7D8I0_9RHOB|nr:type VI secretion system protein TssA [Paracoccus isoporae]SDE47948.1 type VI secretion system protein ImpA [Paracoccus isoporae]
MDLESLLSPLSGDQPSGVELRNDARFHSIERLLEPAARSQRTKPDGALNESATPVDWGSVLSQSEELSASGRDLRLLVILVRALFATDGFEGLSQGLILLRRSIADYWDSLHPALRDRDDPQAAAMARINALRQLENDDNGLLGDLRFGVAFSPRGIGPVMFDHVGRMLLSDFDVQAGLASGLGQAEKDAALARHHDRANRAKAACRAMAAEHSEEVAGMLSAISVCLAELGTLGTTFAEKAGLDPATGLSFSELSGFLDNLRKSLEVSISETAGDPQSSGEGNSAGSGGNGPAADAPASPAPQAASRPASGSGEINSRDDVERALDRIVAFYERTEPSSPIPHVAKRLRRMVSMDFLQLMNEIAPSGLKEFRNIAGLEDGKK